MIEGYLVAKQIGIPLACKCLIRRPAPMIDENDTVGSAWWYKHGGSAFLTQNLHI